MSNELNKLLKKAYNRYKNDSKPPVPINHIREYLELEGIPLDEDNGGG